MALNPLHEAHIRGVAVTFSITGPNLDPAAVTAATSLTPDDAARRGDERRGRDGQALSPRQEGRWCLGTRGKVASLDVREHFRYLQGQLLPHRDALRSFAPNTDSSFGVIWKSTYLYAGTGPLLDPESVAGVAALGAGIAFDIYQVDEGRNDGSDPPEA